MLRDYEEVTACSRANLGLCTDECVAMRVVQWPRSMASIRSL